MNPNLNNPVGIHHHHQQSSNQQQHNHTTHLPPAHTTHPSHHHQPQHLLPDLNPPLREQVEHQQQQQQRSNIEHYKSSATPAYDGYIGSTHDALIIFSGCYLGHFPMVSRRLHERERRSIRSGAVYVFDETKAGIKRWTDGRVWSPSRILNNFLVYREIDHKRPPANSSATSNSSTNPSTSTSTNTSNNNNTANTSTTTTTNTHTNNTNIIPKRDQDDTCSFPKTQQQSSTNPTAAQAHQHTNNNNNSQYHQQFSSNPPPPDNNPLSSSISPLEHKPSIHKDTENQTHSTTPREILPTSTQQRPINRERERSLVGSLTSTYKFRPDGLVKKTISIAGMHMISYYKLDDVVSGRLRAPTSHVALLHIQIVPHLLNPGFFRNPPVWGVSNGRFWIQEEGPEESSQQISSSATAPNSVATTTSTTSLRPTPLSLSASGASSSATSNPAQVGIRSSRPPIRPPNPSTAISRPTSPSSSTGSPSARSPTSPHSFSLLPPPPLSSHNNTGPAPSSPIINPSVGSARAHYSSSIHNNSNSNNNNNGAPVPSGSTHIGRSSTITSASSSRYEPYPRPTRSPPLSASSSGNNTLNDQQNSVPYYNSTHHTTSTLNYSPHSFLPDSHSASLVGPDQQPVSNRNTRHDPSAHEGRNSLESVHQVGGYDDSVAYRAATSTSDGGEALYSQYGITDSASNAHRSSSVPPSSYGLPSINRLGGSGQPVGSSPNTGARGMSDYPFSGSPSQQPQTNRIPSSRHTGSYGGYLSPVVTESTFQTATAAAAASSGGTGGLVERDSHGYAPGQGSPGSGTKPSSFLYPTSSSASTNPSSGYPFSSGNNPSRRGSTIATNTLAGDMGNSTSDPALPGARIGSQNRTTPGGLQLNENNSGSGNGSSNGASHWPQISSSHVMKKEEGTG
ncbi:uncharacterized protein VP01_854g1 [Puccinia sorghi]|uniref:Uncharacterized protein n=1 Tax=Puccinia sorghi TaxID=27349 RepID=A0A0L6U954_9BASI|nr:uncharacterized protein VP01_854g1 [Puccinia sorghi]